MLSRILAFLNFHYLELSPNFPHKFARYLEPLIIVSKVFSRPLASVIRLSQTFLLPELHCMKLLNSPKIDILLHKIVDSLENQEACLILFFSTSQGYLLPFLNRIFEYAFFESFYVLLWVASVCFKGNLKNRHIKWLQITVIVLLPTMQYFDAVIQSAKEIVRKFWTLKVYLSLVICLFTFAGFLSNMISVKRNFNIKTVWEKCFQRFRKWPFQEGRRNIIWKTKKHTNST